MSQQKKPRATNSCHWHNCQLFCCTHTLKGKRLCWLYLQCQQSLFLHRLILVDTETWRHICLSDLSDLLCNDTEQLSAKYPVSYGMPPNLRHHDDYCPAATDVKESLTGTLTTSETSQYKHSRHVVETPQLSEDWRNIAKHVNLAYVRKTLGIVSFQRNDDASDWPSSHQTSLFRHVFSLSSYLLPLNFALEIFYWLSWAKCSLPRSFRIFKWFLPLWFSVLGQVQQIIIMDVLELQQQYEDMTSCAYFFFLSPSFPVW